MSISFNTFRIKEIASQLGFDFCGIAKARYLEEEAPLLEKWLRNQMHGNMAYMERHLDMRLDPTKLVPGAKSIISLIYNYAPEKEPANESYKVARYAYGKDYHDVIKDKLKIFLRLVEEKIGHVEGRAFVDSAPVMERQWAQLSGLGWKGKNSLLLNKKMGSYFFLAELIIDLPLEPDIPGKDHCGTCTRCMDACPTDAIVADGIVDASRCISYLTIELKDEIPQSLQGEYKDWIFGCDICQEVCPWNKFAKPHQEPGFTPYEEILHYNKKEWEEITEDVFSKIFAKSPLKRAKFSGLKKNIDFLKNEKPPL